MTPRLTPPSFLSTLIGEGQTADLRPPPRAVAFNGNFTRKEGIRLKTYAS